MVSIPKSLRHWSVSAHRFLAESIFPFSARMNRKGSAGVCWYLDVVGLDGDDTGDLVEEDGLGLFFML